MYRKNKLAYFTPLAGLLAGFFIAWLAAGVHSTFFILLPLAAFVLGFFSSWGWGLISGFLLFMSYTFSLALMWEVRWAFLGFSQYIGAFIFGGLTIPLIGALAPITRSGFKKAGPLIVTAMLVVVVAWCAYISIPHYRYSYGVNILCEEDMELYLPAAAAKDALSTQLLATSITRTGSNPPDWYNIEPVETEYGLMWKMGMHGRLSHVSGQLGFSSNWYYGSDEIRAWPGKSPVGMLPLAQRSNVRRLDMPEPYEPTSWPAFITADTVLDIFDTPVKVVTENQTYFELFLYNEVDRISGVNFGFSQMNESYIERIDHYRGLTSDNWMMVPAESLDAVSVRGMGD